MSWPARFKASFWHSLRHRMMCSLPRRSSKPIRPAMAGCQWRSRRDGRSFEANRSILRLMLPTRRAPRYRRIMTSLDPPRLSATHMEDLAYFTLAARPDGDDFDAYVAINDKVRQRLRVRAKQMSRYDWPSHMGEDPGIRRGYTLRQCLRLMVVLQMLDAHLPPSFAVRVARNNELGIMDIIAGRLREPKRIKTRDDDPIVIVSPAEIRDLDAGWPATNSLRLQYVELGNLSTLWSGPLGGPGSRLSLDVGAAAATVWRWLSGRRLFDDSARTLFLADIDSSSDRPRYQDVPTRNRTKS